MRLLSISKITNYGDKHKNNANQLLSTRTQANDVAKHKNNANESAKHKNNGI